MRLKIFFTLLFCSNFLYAQENTAFLPDKTESITDEKLLAKKMFTSALTKIENGSFSGLILKKEGQFHVIWRDPDGLQEKCQEDDDCRGFLYVSAHNVENKGELFYRVHNNKNFNAACSWVEYYPKALSISDELKQFIFQHALSLVQTCFKPKSKGN